MVFVVNSTTAYRIHKPFAAFCARQGRAIAFIYDRPPDAFFEQILVDAQAMGAKVVSLDAAIAPGPHDSPWSLFNRAPARARSFDQVRRRHFTPRMAAFSNLIFGRLKAARTLLNQIKPAVVVVAEDGVAGPIVLIAAAQRLDIPVAVLPFGYGTERDFEIALDAKVENEDLERATGPAGEAVQTLAPEWIKRGAHAGALLFPAEYIVVLESAGITVRNSWVVHGGTADRLLVESPQMLALYQAERLPADKLALVGSPYGDFVLDALSKDRAVAEAFRQPRKIEQGCTRILVSWPPSYHASRGALSEFRTYFDMTRAVLAGLSAIPGAQVTVSLHPAVSANDRAAIGGLDLQLTDDYVVELIPRHDIFVTYFSSTIRWAVASGKPVLNYDAYQLALDVYDEAPGVVTLQSAEQLLARARQLTISEAAFAAVATEQVRVAPEWGLLDAPAMPRILESLELLSA